MTIANRYLQTVHSIEDSVKKQTAFKKVRVTNSENSPIPKNIMNMNKSETFPMHLLTNITKSGYSTINSTRRGPVWGTNKQRFGFATNYQIIRFIMWGYYNNIYNPNNNNNNRNTQMYYFHKAISKLTSLNNLNETQKIPVVRLYRLLSRLNRTTLIKLATIINW